MRCDDTSGAELGAAKRRVNVKVRWSDTKKEGWHAFEDVLAFSARHQFNCVGGKRLQWTGVAQDVPQLCSISLSGTEREVAEVAAKVVAVKAPVVDNLGACTLHVT